MQEKEKKELRTRLRDWMETFMMRSMHGTGAYLKEKGLSMPQFSLMMRLYHIGECEVHDIGEVFDISAAGASQLVDKLVQNGLVMRTESPDDRRVRRIALTAKGRALINQGVDERYRWLDDLLDAMSPADEAAILKGLSAMLEVEKKLPGGRILVWDRDTRDAIKGHQVRP
jgi:DNA-binding MarR family transcriptional regulator